MRQIFPSHDGQLKRLSKIEGQIKGVRKMIEDQRYCVDIISQIKAVVGALEKVQLGVLEKHVHHCVRESLESKSPENFEEKVEELVRILARMG